jgi:hypothetical protein
MELGFNIMALKAIPCYNLFNLLIYAITPTWLAQKYLYSALFDDES